MTTIRRFTYTNPTINKMIVDQLGFTWLAFNKGSDGFCHLKAVATESLDLLYYDISIVADKILDLKIFNSYIYVLLLNGSQILNQYSTISPLSDNNSTNNYNYNKPFGIPSPLELTINNSGVYVLLPDASGGVTPKILHFGLNGGFVESIYLDTSGQVIHDVASISTDGTDLWLVTNENPSNLVRVYKSGTWHYTITTLIP